MNHLSPWETPGHQFQVPQGPVQMFDPSKFQSGAVYGAPEVRYLDGGNYQKEAEGLQPHFLNPWSAQQQQPQPNEWSNAPAVIGHLSYGNSEYEWPPTTDSYIESDVTSNSPWYQGNVDAWQQPQQRYCYQHRGYVESDDNLVGEQQLYYDGQISSESLSHVKDFPGNDSFPVDPLVGLNFSGGNNMDYLSLEQGKSIQQPEPHFEMISSCGSSTEAYSLSNFQSNDGQVPDQRCFSTNTKSEPTSSSFSNRPHHPSPFDEISGFVSDNSGKSKSDKWTSLTPALCSGQNVGSGARFILGNLECIRGIGGKNVSPPLTGKVQLSKEESFLDQSSNASTFCQRVDCVDAASRSASRDDHRPCLPLNELAALTPSLPAGPGTMAGVPARDQLRKVPELKPGHLQDVEYSPVHIPSGSMNPNNECQNLPPTVQCTGSDGASASTEGISGTLLIVDSNQTHSSCESNVDGPVGIETCLYESAETGQDHQTNICAQSISAHPDDSFVLAGPGSSSALDNKCRSLREAVVEGSVDLDNFTQREFNGQLYDGEVSLPQQQPNDMVPKPGSFGDGNDFLDIPFSFSPHPLEQQRSLHEEEAHEKRLALRDCSNNIPDHLHSVLPKLHREKAMSPAATLWEIPDPLAGVGDCPFPATAVKEPQPGDYVPAEHGRQGSGGLEAPQPTNGLDLLQNTGTGPFKNTNSVKPTHSDCEESVLLGTYKGSGDQTSDTRLNSRPQAVNRQTRDSLVFHQQDAALADVNKGDGIDSQGADLISTGALVLCTVTPVEAEVIPRIIAHTRSESIDSVTEDMINYEKESALVTKNLEWKTVTECVGELHSETTSHTRHLGSEVSSHPKSERIVTQELDPADLFNESEKNLLAFDENQLKNPTSSKQENLINPSQKPEGFKQTQRDNTSGIRQSAVQPNGISCLDNSNANREIGEQDKNGVNERMDEQGLQRNSLPSDDRCVVQNSIRKSTSSVGSSPANYRESQCVADKQGRPHDGHEESRSRQDSALDPSKRPQPRQGCTDDPDANPCSRKSYPKNHDDDRPKYTRGYPDESYYRPGSEQGYPDHDQSRSKPSSRPNYPNKYRSHARQGHPADNHHRPKENCSEDMYHRSQSHQDYPVDDYDQRRSRQGHFDACPDNSRGRSQHQQDNVKSRKQEHNFGDSYIHGIYDHSLNDSKSRRGYQDSDGYKVHQGYSDEIYERPRSSDLGRSYYRSEHGNDRVASERGHRDRGDHERCGYEDYYREYYNRYIALQYAYQHGGYQHYFPFLQYPNQYNTGYLEETARCGQMPMDDANVNLARGSHPDHSFSVTELSSFGVEPGHNVDHKGQSYGHQDQITYKEFRCPLTPMKFTVPHVKASFGPTGRLVHVLPNSPADGHPGIIELIEVNDLFIGSPKVDELRRFPGPLIRHETHKNDVLLYCQKMALECQNNVNLVDRESAQLIWRYLELLIKQNGTVIGTDIASLLLEGGHEPTSGAYEGNGLHVECSHEGLNTDEDGPLSLIDEECSVINKSSITIGVDESANSRYRHLLLHGRKKDALGWAMRRNLWGHALFLASKMDSKTHANVMTQFVNASVKMNDPLQTLYQIMSGRQPAAVTLIGDDKWGDWRPHLSIILSNPTQRTELDRKSIVTLGDTLASRGLCFASQFCYIIAHVPFGCYHKKSSKIVLLGAAHSSQFEEFATNAAIQCTETYEYGLSLANPNLVLHEFLVYKFIYILRLIDCGLLEEALKYTEVLSGIIVQAPGIYPPALVRALYNLSYGLRLCDPQILLMDGAEEVTWFQQLRQGVQRI